MCVSHVARSAAARRSSGLSWSRVLLRKIHFPFQSLTKIHDYTNNRIQAVQYQHSSKQLILFEFNFLLMRFLFFSKSSNQMQSCIQTKRSIRNNESLLWTFVTCTIIVHSYTYTYMYKYILYRPRL